MSVVFRFLRGVDRRTHVEPRGVGDYPANRRYARARGRVIERGDERLRAVPHDELSLAPRAQAGWLGGAQVANVDGATATLSGRQQNKVRRWICGKDLRQYGSDAVAAFVEINSHYYSVPYTLIGKEPWARYMQRTVEVFHRDNRVAVHWRGVQPRTDDLASTCPSAIGATPT